MINSGYNSSQFVIDAIKKALDKVDCNQYIFTKVRMDPVVMRRLLNMCWSRPRLKKVIADIYSPFFGAKINLDIEVVIIIEVNEDMFNAFMIFIESGDEVIVFESFFDQYASILFIYRQN